MSQIIEVPGIGSVEFPDGMNDADIVAAIKRNSMRPLAPEQISEHAKRAGISSFRAEHPIATTLADFVTGATGLSRGALNLIGGDFGNRVFPPMPGAGGAARFLGSLADPVGLAIGLGTPYAPILSKTATAVAPAVRGGGALAVGKNLATGAAGGGAIGALSDYGDATMGATIGGLTNAVLPPVVSHIAPLIGRGIDALRGRLPLLAAGDIARESAGADVNAIRAAALAAPQDLTAAQATQGIGNDVVAALGEFAARNDPASFYSRLAERQRQDQLAALRRVAGGATQTEARQAAEQSKANLNALTTPMRETELAAANVAGTTGRRLEGQAGGLAEAASERVGDVRRLSQAQQTADELAQSGQMRLGPSEAYVGNPPLMGMPRISGRYGYGTELANLAERKAQDAADSSLHLGEGARFAKFQADSLAAHGLRPMNTDALMASIAAKVNDPAVGTNPNTQRALLGVADLVSQWKAKGGGVIDAEALYGIRKNLNATIEGLLGATGDPKTLKAAAASIATKIRPLIDDAIEQAGGTGWRAYLDTFSQGMDAINRRTMGAKALSMFEKSPRTLESLASGNEPKAVQKVFGSEYDFRKAMGASALPIQDVAAQVARDRLLAEAAARGEGGLQRVLTANLAGFRLPNWIDPRIAVINRALKESELRINEATLNHIVNGMKSGRNLAQLLDALPALQRNKVAEALKAVPPGVLASTTTVGVLSGD